jgi:hypothetical protein
LGIVKKEAEKAQQKMGQHKNPRDEDDALDDLFGDLFEDDTESCATIP